MSNIYRRKFPETGSDWIAYVGNFRFPEGEAGSRRVYGIARSLVEAGFHVVVGSGESVPLTPSVLYCSGDSGRLSFVGIGERHAKSASIISKLVRSFVTLGKRTVSWLDKQPIKPSHVIIYGPTAPFLLRLLPWCRRNGVLLVVDVVEWYHSSHMLGGIFGPFNISYKRALRVLNPKTDGVIAISSYLENYYQKRGCRVIRVPSTLDTTQVTATRSGHNRFDKRLKLAYAGDAGKKDLINNVIEAILQLDSAGDRIQFCMVGPSETEILCLPSLRFRRFSSLPPCIKAIGRQPHEKAMEIVQSADFMPLLRPQQRYAQAGFPTKVPESMALGTPLICNITSDLGYYIHDGVEGLICRDHSVEAFKESLEHALVLTPAQRDNMRIAARVQAEHSFDHKLYAQPLRRFLESMR